MRELPEWDLTGSQPPTQPYTVFHEFSADCPRKHGEFVSMPAHPPRISACQTPVIGVCLAILVGTGSGDKEKTLSLPDSWDRWAGGSRGSRLINVQQNSVPTR